MEKRLTTRQAAEKLQSLGITYTAGSLEVMRCRGRGPEFVKVGRRCFYTESALLAFAEGRPVKTRDAI